MRRFISMRIVLMTKNGHTDGENMSLALAHALVPGWTIDPCLLLLFSFPPPSRFLTRQANLFRNLVLMAATRGSSTAWRQ